MTYELGFQAILNGVVVNRCGALLSLSEGSLENKILIQLPKVVSFA